MPQFTIIIRDEDAVEHYMRRFDTEELGLIVTKLDQSLNVKPRRKRADAGKSRTEGAAS